jgi:transposase InsO family protein
MTTAEQDEPLITTREGRRVVITRLRTKRDRGEPLARAEVERAADQLGVTPRHIRRLINQDMAEPKKAWKPNSDHWDAYYAAHGIATKALAYCRARGIPVPVKQRQFQRGFAEHADQGLRAGAGGGWSGVVSRQGYLPRQVPHKCFAYSADHTKPPILIRPDDEHDEPYWLWESTLIDEATRFELVVYTSDGAPDTALTVGLLGAGVEGYHADDGTFIGGKPLHVLSDNGSDLRTFPATAGLVILGVKRQFSGVEKPWQNGRVERKHKTVQRDWCADQPGYINPDLPLRDKDKWLAYWRAHPNELPTREQYDALRHAEHMRYNFKRVHSELGMTPFEAWCADPYEPERAEPEELRLAMLASTSRTVDHGRVRIFSDSYYSDNGALGNYGGLPVQVRYLPGRYEYVEVFYRGEHVCRAWRKENLPAGAVAALTENRTHKRTEFLAHTNAGLKIRAEAARKKLDEAGFADDDLPAMPADGATPWGPVDPDAQPAEAPAAASEALERPNRKPVGYPSVTPEKTAEQEQVITNYRAQEEFA